MSQKKAAPPAAPKERRVLRITPEWIEDRERKRKFEWVTPDDGSEVCVWSSLVGDTLALMSAQVRPGPFADMGVDEGASIRWQVIVSCYDAEPPNGTKVFWGMNEGAVDRLSARELMAILTVSARLNGMDMESAETIKASYGTQQGKLIGSLTYWCVEKLGRLPQELEGLEMSEQVRSLTLWGMVAEEVEAETTARERRAAGDGAFTPMSPLEGVW